ncbi:uncharacterized protein LOC6610776 [Drosophila sechellia]|uniref:GM13978 n=2 Tax=melanogaster subgroup TaxID=32351 RepID=B4HU57_DROSE|nr:uncharacterized protein LOC6610776 [Drosophila sechellia]XP_033159605.1 uncharacterized protein LOC117140667 [Drosophila mauritiana]EDW50478.1 GM13978 [Drosophila sechellia]
MMMPQFVFWRRDAKKSQLEQISPIWRDLNATFVTVLSWSWLIYAFSALVIITCAYFAYCERCRRTESVRRRRVIQRAQERPPQKRRPNAAYRDHQIYRHIILSVAKYMKNPDGIRPFIEHMEQLYPLRHNSADQQQVAEPSTGED